jgi:Nickel responsive protein SCO4226-like
MTVYMVERELAGIAMEDLAGAQKAAITKAAEMTAAGTEVKYLRSTFAPQDGRCMCLFEAGTEAEVKRLNDEAGLPYERVVEALDLTP